MLPEMTGKGLLGGPLLAGVLATALWQAPAAAAACVDGGTTELGPTAAEQCYTVAAGVTELRVIAVGAPGGAGSSNPGKGTGGAGADGARVQGVLSVTPGETLYVEVGGPGHAGEAGGGESGWNGGGTGTERGGGGGGASDLRTVSCAGACPGSAASLASRLLIAAGGGGGGGAFGFQNGGNGGTAASTGGPEGQSGNAGNGVDGGRGGFGATSSAGGAGGAAEHCFGPPGLAGEAGALAHGGAGGAGTNFAGGGGGGLYGGGGGGGGGCNSGGGGGGGGSSLGPAGTTFALAQTAPPSVTIAPLAPPAVASPSAASPAAAPASGSPEAVSIVTAGTRIVRGRAAVKLFCAAPAGRRCRGTVALVRARRVRRGHGLGAVKIVLGRVSFTIGAGRTATVSVPASRVWPARLPPRARRAVRALAVATLGAGTRASRSLLLLP